MFFSLHISLLTSILLGAGLLLGGVYTLWQCVRAARLRRFVEVDEVQRDYADQLPPVTVIVDACTETGQLSQYLPMVLAQDYPEFEVVVVANTEAEATGDALSALKVEHSNLHVTFAPRGTRTLSRKKLALMIGIKAAHHDIVLTTCANCRPAGDQWLRLMMRNFTPEVDIVLGYSHYRYRRDKRWGRRMRVIDTVSTGAQWVLAAIHGHPYRGVTENLAYRKQLFYDNNGFAYNQGYGQQYQQTYDNNYPEDQAVKNFVVANITGSDCRQLIHVENGKHFVIRNIKARNITQDFSKKAGIDNATVAIYGCDNFVIDNIEMINSAGMLIGYGVIKGNYLSIPQNFRVNNIQLDNTHLAYKLRGLQISAGNAVSFVALTNIEMKRASLELHNKPQHLFLRNIKVMQESSVGPALIMNFDMRKDVRGVFMAKEETLLSLANVHAVNEKGQSSVDIDRINHHIVNVEKINFRLPERRE